MTSRSRQRKRRLEPRQHSALESIIFRYLGSGCTALGLSWERRCCPYVPPPKPQAGKKMRTAGTEIIADPEKCFQNQESPRQTKPKKGPKRKVHEFRPYLWILVFFLRKQARFTSNLCSGMSWEKFMNRPFFGLVCRGHSWQKWISEKLLILLRDRPCLESIIVSSIYQALLFLQDRRLL